MTERAGHSQLNSLAAAMFYLRFYRDPIGAMVRIHRERGALVPIRRGGKPILFGFGPRYNQMVLGNPKTFHSKSVLLPGPPGSAQYLLNAGLLSMNGERHQQHRRLLIPPFARKSLATYHAVMARIIEDVLDTWTPGEERDVAGDVADLATRISSNILFGIEDKDEACAVAAELRHWLHQNFRLPVRILRRDLPGAPFRTLLTAAQRAERKVRAMIDQHRARAAEGRDVLSILLRAFAADAAQLTEEELIGHAAILFGASHETTIAALCWTLLLLFQHPQVCHDLLDELDGCLKGEAPTPEQLDRLPLLDGVVNESLRLVPPVAFSSRRAVEPIEVEGSAWPAGTTFVFSHYVTHHMEELYPKPQRFLPQRWLSIHPTPYEFLPFSAGPRLCIGMEFSLMEQKITLAMLLQRFRLAMFSNARVNRRSRLVTMPESMRMRVFRQDRRFAAVPLRGNVHEMVDLL